MKDIRVSAVTCRSFVGDIDRNLSVLRRCVETAARQGTELICFPELQLSGYGAHPDMVRYARPIPGAVTDLICDIARRFGVSILTGLPETGDETRCYISHVFAGMDGGLSVYRKLHISPPEKQYFLPGNEIPLFRSGDLKFGVQLCYDAHFPQLSTHLAESGAEILFFPHASPRGTPEGKLKSWMRHLPARAFDNGAFVIACNQSGTNEFGLSFPGVAVFLGPAGHLLHRRFVEEDDFAVLTVDLKAADLMSVRGHPMRFFLPHRRPELFAPGGDVHKRQ
jgi:N-carbamoylputrescine amidase